MAKNPMTEMPTAADYPSRAYAWYVVAFLMLAYVFSYIDRTILTLLVEPIRRDMQISDTQISLLHGLAFALFYTFLGLPLGRVADSRHRVGLISIGILIWSVMTAACGVAKNFWHLFLARMGVGVGEAALSPAAYSIITDYFPPRRLSLAMSVYVMGAYLGMGIAYMVGGVIIKAIEGLPDVTLPVFGHIYSWQLAFFIVGLPGLALCLLVWTIREPVRHGKMVRADGKKAVPLQEVFRYLARNKKTYIAHFSAFGALALLINGIALWTPTFMVRTYDWQVGNAGIVYGAMIFVFGGGGLIFGGWYADYMEAKGVKGSAFVASIQGAGLAILPTFLMPLMPNATMALILMGPAIFFGSFPFGLAVSSIHQITPNEMRGQVSAVYLFFVNLIGIGSGPTIIALLTDYVFKDDLALHYSMSIVGGTSALLATIFLLWGLKYFRVSLEKAEVWKNNGGAGAGKVPANPQIESDVIRVTS